MCIGRVLRLVVLIRNTLAALYSFQLTLSKEGLPPECVNDWTPLAGAMPPRTRLLYPINLYRAKVGVDHVFGDHGDRSSGGFPAGRRNAKKRQAANDGRASLQCFSPGEADRNQSKLVASPHSSILRFASATLPPGKILPRVPPAVTRRKCCGTKMGGVWEREPARET